MVLTIIGSWNTFVLCILFIVQYTKGFKGPCEYKNAKRIESCNEQEVSGQYINVYHTNSEKLEYQTTCRCIITGKMGEKIIIRVTDVPRVDDCGTSVYIFQPDNVVRIVNCTTKLGTEFSILLTTQENITVTLEFRTDANTTSLPYCLYAAEAGSASMSINCASKRHTSTQTAFSASSSTQTTIDTTTTTESAVTDFTLSITSNNDTVDGSNVDDTTTISFNDESLSNNLKQIPLEIVIPAAGGGFVLVLVLIVVVSCTCKSRGRRIDEKSKYDAPTQDVEDDGMIYNVMYESSDNVESVPVDDFSFNNKESGYADVEIPTTDTGQTIDDNKDNFSSFNSEDHDIPVYSVPNKIKRDAKEQNDNVGPIYALPIKSKKTTNESPTNTSNHSSTKPQTLPKPTKELQRNADGIRYTDLN